MTQPDSPIPKPCTCHVPCTCGSQAATISEQASRIEELEAEIEVLKEEHVRWIKGEAREMTVGERADMKQAFQWEYNMRVARDAEIERLRTEGSPGVMHATDKAFYDLTIKQRDAAWRQVQEVNLDLVEAGEALRQHQAENERKDTEIARLRDSLGRAEAVCSHLQSKVIEREFNGAGYEFSLRLEKDRLMALLLDWWRNRSTLATPSTEETE